MGRTFISQPTQIFRTETHLDNLDAGPALENPTTSSDDNLEYDLNALRSQVRRIIWTGSSGSWYTEVTGSGPSRGVAVINSDLFNLEQHKMIYRTQKITPLVSVPSGQNWVELYVVSGTTPSSPVAVGETTLTGTIAAEMTGTWGRHELEIVSGSSDISPKNLVVIRDASSGEIIEDAASGSSDVYALMQVENSFPQTGTINDVDQRAQLSFVVDISGSLVPASVSAVSGKSINYSYPRRIELSELPEDAYMSNHIFLDIPAASLNVSGNAVLSDITLQRAIDNQAGTVTQNGNIVIDLGDSYSWSYVSGTQTLWSIIQGATSDELLINVDYMHVSSTQPTSFQQGINVASGSTTIRIGVVDGQIDSAGALIVSASEALGFNDDGGLNSSYGGPILFSSGTSEWNDFYTYFGPDATILNAFTALSQSLSSSLQDSGRTRFNAGVTTNPRIIAGTNVRGGVNLDATLGDYSCKDFQSDVDIYVNGVLLQNGPSGSFNDLYDVFPGTDAASGDLRFSENIRTGSQIAMVIHGQAC